jgi:sporulation protein YlmC with PRC-barrel domain
MTLKGVAGGILSVAVLMGLCAVAAAEEVNQAAAADTAKNGTAKTFRASKLIGLTVKNSEGDKLGSVNDIVVEVDSGRIAYVALSFGGVLGIGDKLFAVPYRQIRLVREQEEMYLVLNVPKDRLKTAPGFDKNQWPDFADPYWIEKIDKYYGESVSVKPADTP